LGKLTEKSRPRKDIYDLYEQFFKGLSKAFYRKFKSLSILILGILENCKELEGGGEGEESL
jgi:hypothetical protein